MDLMSGDHSGANSPQTEQKSYTEIMHERFQKANALVLPIIDQKDCNQRCQVKLTPIDQMH